MSADADKKTVGRVGTISLHTTVADLSTTAILAACGQGVGGADETTFDGYLTVNSALGTFHLHIHACAKPVIQAVSSASRTH